MNGIASSVRVARVMRKWKSRLAIFDALLLTAILTRHGQSLPIPRHSRMPIRRDDASTMPCFTEVQ